MEDGQIRSGSPEQCIHSKTGTNCIPV
jgi:hypothetical protein